MDCHGGQWCSRIKNDSPLKKETVFPADFKPEDITYGVLGGQYIYLLSQLATVEGKPTIDLSNTLYGIPQDKFIGDENTLYNKTFSSVRGEQIMLLLVKMTEFLFNHVHTCAGYAPDETCNGSKTTKKDITDLLNKANNNILNQNIRLN
jgi:hypothetical protein